MVRDIISSTEQQAIVSSDVKSVVSFKEDGGVDLTFSFKWATNCIPLMNLEILNVSSGNIVAHFNSLIPSYHGSGAERTLSLRLATTADLLMNTHYTAHLTSISAQRELGAEGAVSFSKQWKIRKCYYCTIIIVGYFHVSPIFCDKIDTTKFHATSCK